MKWWELEFEVDTSWVDRMENMARNNIDNFPERILEENIDYRNIDDFLKSIISEPPVIGNKYSVLSIGIDIYNEHVFVLVKKEKGELLDITEKNRYVIQYGDKVELFPKDMINPTGTRSVTYLFSDEKDPEKYRSMMYLKFSGDGWKFENA